MGYEIDISAITPGNSRLWIKEYGSVIGIGRKSPVLFQQFKITCCQMKFSVIIRAAEAETEQPVFVLAAFGNSFDTDKAFLAHVVRQSLPVGRPLAVMINAGFAPTNYRGLFRSVRQKKVVGDR